MIPISGFLKTYLNHLLLKVDVVELRTTEVRTSLNVRTLNLIVGWSERGLRDLRLSVGSIGEAGASMNSHPPATATWGEVGSSPWFGC